MKNTIYVFGSIKNAPTMSDLHKFSTPSEMSEKAVTLAFNFSVDFASVTDSKEEKERNDIKKRYENSSAFIDAFIPSIDLEKTRKNNRMFDHFLKSVDLLKTSGKLVKFENIAKSFETVKRNFLVTDIKKDCFERKDLLKFINAYNKKLVCDFLRSNKKTDIEKLDFASLELLDFVTEKVNNKMSVGIQFMTLAKKQNFLTVGLELYENIEEETEILEW